MTDRVVMRDSIQIDGSGERTAPMPISRRNAASRHLRIRSPARLRFGSDLPARLPHVACKRSTPYIGRSPQRHDAAPHRVSGPQHAAAVADRACSVHARSGKVYAVHNRFRVPHPGPPRLRPPASGQRSPVWAPGARLPSRRWRAPAPGPRGSALAGSRLAWRACSSSAPSTMCVAPADVPARSRLERGARERWIGWPTGRSCVSA